MVLILLCVSYLIVASAYAQVFPEGNGKVLAGIRSFDAFSVTKTWLNIESDKENFERNVDDSFKLGLRRDRIIVDKESPYYLICEVWAAQRENVVMYHVSVGVYIFSTDDVHIKLWSQGGIATVGILNFSSKMVSEDCVDIFSNEWLKQNPNVR